MSLEELKRQFIVDENVLKAQLEPLIKKALDHCRLDKEGQVVIRNQRLTARDQILLVISARAIAAELAPGISAEVTFAELAKFTRVPADQIRARSSQLIKSRLAESPERGVLRAIPHRIEAFLDSISSVHENRSGS